MRLFAEVVKQGSFSRAADHLGVSKGYLSKHVKKLEVALGKQLLVRNTRTMRLTSAGEILYQQAKNLTGLWQQSKSLLEQSEQQLSGMVKCTAPVGVAKHILWPIFSQILRDHPEISIITPSGNDTHNLNVDDFDFAVRITNTPPQDMIARHLSHIEYVCCAAPQFIDQLSQQGIKLRTPAQLTHLDCLVLSHWNEWHFYNDKEVEKIKPKGKFVASDNDLLKQACIDGLGIARLPEYMVGKEIASQKLVRVLGDIKSDQRELYLIYPQMSARSSRVSLCLDKIINHFD